MHKKQRGAMLLITSPQAEDSGKASCARYRSVCCVRARSSRSIAAMGIATDRAHLGASMSAIAMP